LICRNGDAGLISQVDVTKALALSFVFGLAVALGFGFYFAS